MDVLNDGEKTSVTMVGSANLHLWSCVQFFSADSVMWIECGAGSDPPLRSWWCIANNFGAVRTTREDVYRVVSTQHVGRQETGICVHDWIE